MSPYSWREEAALRARSEADLLVQLAAAEEQAEHLSIKLVEAQAERAHDRAILDNYIERLTAELDAARLELDTLKAAGEVKTERKAKESPEASPVPDALDPYLPMCRQCRERFESDNPQSKACPMCKGQTKAKPTRPGLTASAQVATAPAPKKPPGRPGRPRKNPEADATPYTPPPRRIEELPDSPPTFNVRTTIACAECVSGKPNKASDTGFECLASRARDCAPMTFARYLSPIQKEA